MTDPGTQPIRVLLVEDEPGDARLVQLALRGSPNIRFEVDWAATLAEALRRLDAQPYAIVLLDLGLPDSTSLATLTKVRAVHDAPPIIVLTGLSDAEFGLATLKSGAADYLVKGDFGYDGLARTILYTLHRTQLEQELTNYQLHLEELVARRTAELAKAKDAAEAANRAKSLFLANMSHELRTPLNAILGFAQIMERDPRIPADERRNIATINRSGSHLLSLINNVLEISRIEAGRTQISREAFDLPATLTAVEEMIRVRADAKALDFVVERCADLPAYVVGDAHRLRQVLINLLGNAVKYTERGRIGLRVAMAGGDVVRFEVTDTGPGIPAEEQEHIFQAFYQTAGGIAKGEGTGLGLTISRQFVRLMDGDITLASQPGAGSSFAFAIPLPPTDAAPHVVSDARVVGLRAGQPSPRILVAEDHPDSQQVVEQLLSQVGCQVRIAANGQLAVDLFQTWHPQLVLMDMRMPVMDGYQATRAIRALPGGDRVPIVALTASAFEEDRDLVLEAGCTEMVKKPIEQNRLFEVIGRLLGLHFEYAEAALAAAKVDLSALPVATREELAKAAVVLDKEATLAIVARMRSAHPAEADLVADLALGYRFDKIEALCASR